MRRPGPEEGADDPDCTGAPGPHVGHPTLRVLSARPYGHRFTIPPHLVSPGAFPVPAAPALVGGVVAARPVAVGDWLLLGGLACGLALALVLTALRLLLATSHARAIALG